MSRDNFSMITSLNLMLFGVNASETVTKLYELI